jgi:hypothetical protein
MVEFDGDVMVEILINMMVEPSEGIMVGLVSSIKIEPEDDILPRQIMSEILDDNIDFAT